MKFYKKIILFLILASVFFWSSLYPCFAETLGENSDPCDIVFLVNDSFSMRNFDKAPINSFINKLDSKNRLQIISFGDKAKTIQKLRPITDAEKNKAIIAFNKLNFSENKADINIGLTIALANLINRGHKTAVIVITSGFTDRIGENLISGYIKNKTSISTITVDNTSIPQMQTIANKTSGVYSNSQNSATLGDSLKIVSAELFPAKISTPAPVSNPSQQKSSPSPAALVKNSSPQKNSSITLTLILVFLLVILIIIGLFVLMYYRKLLNSTSVYSLNADHPKFPSLQENVNELTAMVTETGDRLELFKKELDVYGCETWYGKIEATERYNHVVNNLFFLLDGLEREKLSGNVQRVYNQVRQILEDEEIEEIPVKTGQLLNDKYHCQIDQDFSDLSQGTIIEIAKKGYCQKCLNSPDKIILRQAEVITSNGKKKNGNTATKKVLIKSSSEE